MSDTSHPFRGHGFWTLGRENIPEAQGEKQNFKNEMMNKKYP